jgi:hypothetical protein
MPTTEHTINDALAAALRTTRRAWSATGIVSSENTGMLKGSNRRPDILVTEANVSPVAIETEVLPAITVESEASSRLGEELSKTGRKILSSIAVRLPLRLRSKAGAALQTELARANDLEVALFTGIAPANATRWPASGWIVSSVADLSILTQSASVPPDVIEKAADQLVEGVSFAAGLLQETSATNPGSIHKISEQLRQEDGEQTRRMATTILANAFVFHETLAGGPGDLANVASLEELRSKTGGLTKSVILAEWRKILKVNYWPIFDIARRILEVIPPPTSNVLIERMADTADKLLENRLMRSHDLTGAVFQRLIADRKFLAAFYTTPASAALLIGLAIAQDRPPCGGSWGSADDVKTLRIADFACGTGTLLSTAYQRVGQLHELAGGDSEALHPDMMAHSLIGCDVLPAAAHLTASMLSGAHPTVKYTQSSIMTVAYGMQPDGGVALGSLDLLDPQRKFEILDITAKAFESMGESEKELWSALPHASFDVVIMNPPFTRATSHEGKKKDVPNPMFAAFSSSAKDQKAMAEATKRLTAGTSAHGNAGEASVFLVLADRKLKEGGTLALVLPLSLMLGDSWEESRSLLTKSYRDLVIASISGVGGKGLSFSADTDMAECLVIGRKGKSANKRATFVVLNESPAFPLLGARAATQIRQMIASQKIRCLEDGPLGGTLLHFGKDVIGQAIEATPPSTGGWNLSRIADLSLAQAAFQMQSQKRLWLPGMHGSESSPIPITTISIIGKIGPIDRDISGTTPTGGLRGPFSIEPATPKSANTYPALWAHEAAREQTMAFEADCEAIPLVGATAEERKLIEKKVRSVWATASHCHFNRDFRFNSQSTGMQFTPRRTIGGRAWQSIQLPSVKEEKALVLWANTSIGFLLHWWHANKQQPGRGSIGKSAMQHLPILDVTALEPSQLDTAADIFDATCSLHLMPLHEIDRDHVRRELDNEFARKVLMLPETLIAPDGPLELLRMKLAQEPSILGSKG